MPTFNLTANEPVFNGDTVTFAYSICNDETEGEVHLIFTTLSGADARSPTDKHDLSDLTIKTHSDCWGLTDTQAAINDAIALHTALGRHSADDRGG